MKILFLAANPKGTDQIQLDKEAKKIEDGLERSKLRDQFTLVTKWAVDSETLRRAMLNEQPDIVHFSGHGEGKEGLVLVGQDGKPKPATADALAGLFELFRNVKCVLLNACYAEIQAKAIVQHIDYVIGMERAVRDDAAIAFSTGFYDGLGYGWTIEDAFKLGRNAIQFEISSFSSIERKLIPVDFVNATEKLERIPDHLIPVLLKRETSITGEPAIDSSLELQVTNQTNRPEDAIQQYRERVKEFLADRELTPIEEFQLATLATVLHLSELEANQILQEERNRIEQSKENYKKVLIQTIDKGYYPFNEKIQAGLKNLQKDLELTDGEVEEISRPILEQAEIADREKLRQQAQQADENKRHRYEQEFIRAINVGYPIEDVVRNGLRSFQQSLGLSDEEIERIEQPIIAPKEAEYRQQLAEAQRQREQEEEKAKERSRQQEALERQQREEAERKRAQEEAAKREQQRQIELEGQRQEEERSEQMKTTLGVRLQRLEFDVITVDKNGTENSRTRKSAEFFAEDLGNRVWLDMVRIPGGTYQMGAPEGESFLSTDDERPQHSVTVPPFLMGKYPITQAQWRVVCAVFPGLL